VLKKSAIVGAALAAGLVLGAPLASATTSHPSTGGNGGGSVVDNRGCNGGDGVLNVSCNPVGVRIVGPLT
jgi:hypothetical protein